MTMEIRIFFSLAQRDQQRKYLNEANENILKQPWRCVYKYRL